MDQLAAIKKAENGSMTKSQSVGSLLWRSNASMNATRTLVVRNEALSSSTYSLNWSGVQAHTKGLSRRHESDANLPGENEILAPTVSILCIIIIYKSQKFFLANGRIYSFYFTTVNLRIQTIDLILNQLLYSWLSRGILYLTLTCAYILD